MTTIYGTWAKFDGSRVCIEDTLVDYLNEFVDDFDFDGLVNAYWNAVAEALPNSIVFVGDEFYGPYPIRDDANELIVAALESVDLSELAQRFDRTV